MVLFIMDILKVIYIMEKEFFIGEKIIMNIMENIKMGKKMEKEFIRKIIKFMKVILMKENHMVMVKLKMGKIL